MLSKSSIFVLLLAETSAGYLLPSPPGRYNVILKTGSIDDYSRDARRLMLSVFQPATCATTVPAIYMPNTTAELEGPWISRVFNVSANFTPLLAQARLPVCSDETERCSSLDDAPVLLLSPGFRGSRLYYNFIAAAIASEGFTVIAMDHPGETHAITYSDGHVSESDLPDPTNLDELTPLAYIRATDISFIIDQMNNATAMGKLLALPVRSDRVVVGGHSLGGAAAMLAATHDSRICGVVNWDGPFLGSLPPSGLSQPIIYIATERPEDPRFLTAWPNLNGPKLWVKVANLLHEGMMDFATLLQAAGQDFMDFAGELGSMKPTESVHILTAYTTEWTKGAFAGKVEGSLLEGQEPATFPEVSTVRKGNF